MSDLIDRLRMLKEIAGIEGGCIGDAAANRIAELEAEVSYLRTRDKSQGAYIEQTLDELEAENEELEADKEILLCGMNSIANNSCCGDCQEAKKVAVKCINDLGEKRLQDVKTSISPHVKTSISPAD